MMLRNYAKLFPLPLGSITARGWLREQLLRNRDGMGGHLDELEPQMLLDLYTTKKTDDGWGAEISGNYWLGVIKLAFTLNDGQLIDKVTNWVGEVLKNVDPNGYLGAYKPEDDRQEDYNAWGTAGKLLGWVYHRYPTLDNSYYEYLWCTPCQSKATLESSLPSDVRRDRHYSETTIQHA